MKNPFLPLFLLLLFSCGNHKNTSDGLQIQVDLEKRDPVSFSKWFSRIEIIPLETTAESLIREIGSLQITEDRIYILDYKNRTVLAFDHTGRFLFKIHHRGNGPEEYLHIAGYMLNETDHRVELIDPIRQKLFQYDRDGKFAGKTKLPSLEKAAYFSGHPLNRDTLVFLTSDPANRIKYYSRRQQGFVYETFPEREDVRGFCVLPFIGKNLFCRALNDTVYQLHKNGLTPFYVWDFGKLRNDLSDFHRPKDPREFLRFYQKVSNSETVNYVIRLQAAGDSLFYAQLTRKSKLIHVFHSLPARQTFVFEKSTEGLSIYPVKITSAYILGVYTQGNIEEVLSDAVLSPEERAKLKNILPDDNGALIKYYF